MTVTHLRGLVFNLAEKIKTNRQQKNGAYSEIAHLCLCVRVCACACNREEQDDGDNDGIANNVIPTVHSS